MRRFHERAFTLSFKFECTIVLLEEDAVWTGVRLCRIRPIEYGLVEHSCAGERQIGSLPIEGVSLFHHCTELTAPSSPTVDVRLVQVTVMAGGTRKHNRCCAGNVVVLRTHVFRVRLRSITLNHGIEGSNHIHGRHKSANQAVVSSCPRWWRRSLNSDGEEINAGNK